MLTVTELAHVQPMVRGQHKVCLSQGAVRLHESVGVVLELHEQRKGLLAIGRRWSRYTFVVDAERAEEFHDNAMTLP